MEGGYEIVLKMKKTILRAITLQRALDKTSTLLLKYGGKAN